MSYPTWLKTHAFRFVGIVVLSAVAWNCAISEDGIDLRPQVQEDGGNQPPPPPDDGSERKVLGTACQAPADCQSGFCAQGFCCNSPCTPGCASCGMEGMEGTCAPLAPGAPPRLVNACPKEAASTCGFDGSCDGAFGCRQHIEGTPCGQSTCNDKTENPAPACSGTGQCKASAPRPCSPYLCGPRACATECRRDDQCTDGTVCFQEKCQVADAPLVRRTPGAPQIDGLPDDNVWSLENWIPVSRLLSGSVGSPADLTARFKVLWTRSELFITVDVNDSSLVNDSADPLQDDAIMIVIDPGNRRSQQFDDTRDVRYVFGWNDGDFTANVPERKQAVVFAFRNDQPRGYAFEARIPWLSLGVNAPAEGMRLGFQVAVFDDDDNNNRDAVVAWMGSNMDALTQPALFGQLILGPSQ